MSLAEVTYLLKKNNLRPDDKRGQNFLVNDRILNEIVKVTGVDQKDTVIEVGAGIGNLTSRLTARCRRVIAVEIDQRYRLFLDKLVWVNKNLTVLYDDILKLAFADIRRAAGIEKDGDYLMVANIPYYLTSRLLYQVIKYPLLPKSLNFLIQQEVAKRIVAGAGDHSKLSLSVQFYGDPKIELEVANTNFYPQPTVDSSFLIVKNIRHWRFSEDEQLVWRLIAFGFSSKRKKLINNLMAGLQAARPVVDGYLTEAKIAKSSRAQDLSLEQWRKLAAAVERKG
jgi:16S rRNA (adenine1518-N6/adenine1519-N6)-dimethyltransferase